MNSRLKKLPVPGEVIAVKNKRAVLSSLSRVLYTNEKQDRIVVIPVEPHRSKGRIYFVGPRVVKLSLVMADMGNHLLHILPNGLNPRPDVAATDIDLDNKYRRHGQKSSCALDKRKERYELIRSLVTDPNDRDLLYDPQVRRERIKMRAKEVHDGKYTLQRTIKRISEILNQYFAEGSIPGAVTPYSAAKGGRGKERNQITKLGRKNTPTKKGNPGVSGFVMSEQDKDICGFAWRNYYVRGTTIAKALRRMWREFYAEVNIDEQGKIKHRLLPVHQRPTRTQYEKWGKDRSPGHESWKKQLTKFNLNRIDRVLFGTVDEDIVKVGQRGAIDSTSVDIEFVSVAHRLDRIGSAHRILIVDGLYGYISGFYLGLEAPSAQTVNLAFLHSLTDKKDWLEWLGLSDQNSDNWISIPYRTVIADNTDLRCDAVFSSLSAIGTGIMFVGVARSDLNSPAETGHHSLHRLVDHNLHGTTRGQRHERGEEHADILARHTVIEAIRETARAIYTYNTMELEIHPTLEMRRELLDKGIKLTRANLTRCAINKGRLATSLIGGDEARTKLLLPTRGTFTPHGVKLLRKDTGRKREFIEPVRYISRHPLIIQRIMKSKVGRERVHAESFDDDFLHNPYQPTEIYFRDRLSGELIRLDLATKDNDLPFECCHADILDLMERDALHLFETRESQDQALCEMEAGQELTKQDAADNYQNALDQLEKPPSKASLRAGKKENRQREKEGYQYGMPIQMPNIEDAPIQSAPASLKISESQAEEIIIKPTASPHPAPDGHTVNNSSSDVSSVLLAAILNRRNRVSQNASRK